jgi:hypothetical protein
MENSNKLKTLLSEETYTASGGVRFPARGIATWKKITTTRQTMLVATKNELNDDTISQRSDHLQTTTPTTGKSVVGKQV